MDNFCALYSHYEVNTVYIAQCNVYFALNMLFIPPLSWIFTEKWRLDLWQKGIASAIVVPKQEEALFYLVTIPREQLNEWNNRGHYTLPKSYFSRWNSCSCFCFGHCLFNPILLSVWLMGADRLPLRFLFPEICRCIGAVNRYLPARVNDLLIAQLTEPPLVTTVTYKRKVIGGGRVWSWFTG